MQRNIVETINHFCPRRGHRQGLPLLYDEPAFLYRSDLPDLPSGLGGASLLHDVGALFSRIFSVFSSPPSPPLFFQIRRDPTDKAVAVDVFEVPMDEEPLEIKVNAVYDRKRQRYLDRKKIHEVRGNQRLVSLETDGLAFLDTAYLTLMGHARTTGFD